MRPEQDDWTHRLDRGYKRGVDLKVKVGLVILAIGGIAFLIDYL